MKAATVGDFGSVIWEVARKDGTTLMVTEDDLRASASEHGFENVVKIRRLSQPPLEKPPLGGLRPRWLLEEHRINEIGDTLERHATAGTPTVPTEWAVELFELTIGILERLRAHTRNSIKTAMNETSSGSKHVQNPVAGTTGGGGGTLSMLRIQRDKAIEAERQTRSRLFAVQQENTELRMKLIKAEMDKIEMTKILEASQR